MGLKAKRILFYTVTKGRKVAAPTPGGDSYLTEAGDDITTEADDDLVLE